ncbi:hypothetical protein Tco_1133630 [Tanacetum coccineum]
MNSVVDLMKELEVKEKAVEELKKKVAEGCSDPHAGEVCAEKAILATELKELQLRLFTMSDELSLISSRPHRLLLLLQVLQL